MLILFDLKIKTNIESAGIDPTFPTKLDIVSARLMGVNHAETSPHSNIFISFVNSMLFK